VCLGGAAGILTVHYANPQHPRSAATQPAQTNSSATVAFRTSADKHPFCDKRDTDESAESVCLGDQ
jgi:hypothetical protein